MVVNTPIPCRPSVQIDQPADRGTCVIGGRLKLIRANDGKGGLDGCEGASFAGLQEAEQVLVVDGFLAVGGFEEASVDFVALVEVERVAKFFETVGQGATAGVLAEDELGVARANGFGSH